VVAVSRRPPALLLAVTLGTCAGQVLEQGMAASFSAGRFQGQVIGMATALAPGYVGGFSRIYFGVPLEKTGIGYRVSIIGWDPAGNGSNVVRRSCRRRRAG
jgi:hypothetical protein